jgi:hypothetical protein
MLAMGMLLEQMGKQVDLVSADRIPANCRALPGVDAIRSEARVMGSYDAAILLECDGLARAKLQRPRSFSSSTSITTPAAANLPISTGSTRATSVGELIYRLVKAAGAGHAARWPPASMPRCSPTLRASASAASAASTFELARDLALAGADPIRIAQDVCFSTLHLQDALLGAALRHLKREGKLVWLWVTHAICSAPAPRRGLRGHCELCGVHLRRGGRGFPARNSRNASDEPAQQGPGQRGRDCRAAGRRRPRKPGRLHHLGPLESARDEILGLLRPCLAELAGRENWPGFLEIPPESVSLVPVEALHQPSRLIDARGSKPKPVNSPPAQSRPEAVRAASLSVTAKELTGETLEVETIQEPSAPESRPVGVKAGCLMGHRPRGRRFSRFSPSFSFFMAKPRGLGGDRPGPGGRR